MLRRVALVRTEVSEKRIASIIRMTRVGDGIHHSRRRGNLKTYKESAYFGIIVFLP
jgi:hypothetical protein